MDPQLMADALRQSTTFGSSRVDPCSSPPSSLLSPLLELSSQSSQTQQRQK